jgi:hypothetical protein
VDFSTMVVDVLPVTTPELWRLQVGVGDALIGAAKAIAD